MVVDKGYNGANPDAFFERLFQLFYTFGCLNIIVFVKKIDRIFRMIFLYSASSQLFMIKERILVFIRKDPDKMSISKGNGSGSREECDRSNKQDLKE